MRGTHQRSLSFSIDSVLALLKYLRLVERVDPDGFPTFLSLERAGVTAATGAAAANQPVAYGALRICVAMDVSFAAEAFVVVDALALWLGLQQCVP